MATAPKWDKPAVIAELTRRGYTLTGLARDNGLYESACRQAFDGRCRRGAELIARTLGVPMQDLFPGRYIRRPKQSKSTATIVASQIDAPASDDARAA